MTVSELVALMNKKKPLHQCPPKSKRTNLVVGPVFLNFKQFTLPFKTDTLPVRSPLFDVIASYQASPRRCSAPTQRSPSQPAKIVPVTFRTNEIKSQLV